MNTLIVILGPTGVGKTELCLSLAGLLDSPIISADSRQMYREIPIGTAAPTREELSRIKHYFIGNLSLSDTYSAATYESQATALIDELFKTHSTLLVSGGSMMYIDVLCNGIDDIPTIDPQVRADIMARYEATGLDAMAAELKLLDPEYYSIVDRKNPKRVLHALEVCYMTGGTYTALRTSRSKTRPYRIVKIGLTRPREELYARINARTDKMMQDGLLEEAIRVAPFRKYNSLNTVGYKELYAYMDGALTPDGKPQTLEFAIEKIKQDSRIYSRKQMTWWGRDETIKWFHPDQTQEIIDYIRAL